jgi:hypothetical protein
MAVRIRIPLAIFMGLACIGTATAQPSPQPPCGVQPFPEYAQPGTAPNVHVWSEGNLGKQWMPSTCTGWTPKDGTVVAITSQFRFLGNVDGLLSHFGQCGAACSAALRGPSSSKRACSAVACDRKRLSLSCCGQPMCFSCSPTVCPAASKVANTPALPWILPRRSPRISFDASAKG